MLKQMMTYDARAGRTAGTVTTGDGGVADVTMSMKSIQAAYSMGSMSIKAYRTRNGTNVGYNSKGNSVTTQRNEIALGLSF